MGWLKSLKDMTSSNPIDCPRGWGDVTFSTDIEGFPPFFSVTRKCPIAGVSNCASCGHPHNPARIEQLRAMLAELEQLCDEGKLTESEYQSQRRMLLSFQHSIEKMPGEYALITAWILGPLGILATVAGIFLAQKYHEALYGITAAGAILLAVAASFGGIGWMKRSTYLKHVDAEPEDLFFPQR
jgi:hypothetical protein